VQAWGWLPDRGADRAARQVREALLLLHRHSVEPEKVSPELLATRAIEGMVGELDRYSEYLPAQAYKRLEEDVDGAFGGIGVQIEDLEGRIVVVAPIAGTPGERAGILRGDVLVGVDGRDVRGLKLDEFITHLRGEPGTWVEIEIERGQPATTRRLKLKREIIRVLSVPDVELLADGIGYLRLALFTERTAEEFSAALEKLRAQHARALVLDLRNNPGGLVTAAVHVAEHFMPHGELVVYTEGRDPAQREELRAERQAAPWATPVVVLLNGGSASASEIVAGALRDTRRAVLVGEKSFGKGSVQSLFALREGAGLRLTTARYFTPIGRTIHELGLPPDVPVILTPEQEKAVFLGRLRPDVTDPAAFEKKFGVPPAVDTQLAAARAELLAQLAGQAPTWRDADAPALTPAKPADADSPAPPAEPATPAPAPAPIAPAP
jgi:carboxyl-terminal processing protease